MYLLQRPEDIPPRLTNRLNVRIAVLARRRDRGGRDGAAAALVAAGPLRRALPRPRQGPRRPRRPGAPAPRRDPRPERQGPGRQPHRDEPRAAPLGPAQRSQPSARRELRRLGDLLGLSQREIRQQGPGDAPVRRLSGGPPAGARPAAALLPAREQGELPRRQRRAHLRPRLQGRHRSPPTCSGSSARSARASSSGPQVPGPRSPATSSGRRASSTPTTSSCAAPPGSQRIQVDALGRPRGQLGNRPGPGRRQPAPDARLRVCRTSARRRSAPRGCPAPSWR